MALRFRRSVKIAPGVRLNLSKTGLSARIGPKGAGITVGTSGTTASAGIPGSGLHVSQKLRETATDRGDNHSEEIFEPKRKGLGFFRWLGILVIMLGVLLLLL